MDLDLVRPPNSFALRGLRSRVTFCRDSSIPSIAGICGKRIKNVSTEPGPSSGALKRSCVGPSSPTRQSYGFWLATERNAVEGEESDITWMCDVREGEEYETREAGVFDRFLYGLVRHDGLIALASRTTNGPPVSD